MSQLKNERTVVTLHVTAAGPTAEAAAMLEGMPKSWAQTVDRLDLHLDPNLEKGAAMQYRMLREKLILAAFVTAATAPASAAADKYEIEPNHTYPSFEFSHMGISVWRGKFDRTSGRISIDRAAGTGTAEIVIDTTSIDFGLDKMDEAARAEDWFNVAKFPTATYRGTLKFTGDVPKIVEGQFTLLGVTRPVKLTINSFKCIPHPMFKKEVCGADAEGDLNWSEYGMKNSKYGEGDAGRVHLRIQVEAVKQD